MSAHVEWMDTSHPFLSFEVVPAGTEVPDEGEFATNSPALVISADTIVVIEGDTERLIQLLQDALDELKIRHYHPSLRD